MKRLVLLLIAGALLAFAVRNLPHYSIFRLQRGLEAGDLNVVGQYADLTRFAELPVDITVAMAAAGMRDAAGVVGETLVKLFGGAVGATIKQVGGQVAVQEMRTRIERHDLLSLLGGFRPKEGFNWWGGVEFFGSERAIFTLVGTCDSRENPKERVEARMGIDLARVKGPVLGLPFDWRAMGVEANSLKQLIRDCTFSF